MRTAHLRERHLSLSVVILLLLFLLWFPNGYASGGTFVVNDKNISTDYSITVSYDGVKITSSDIDFDGRIQVHYGATMHRGDTFTISVSWSYSEGHKHEYMRTVSIGGNNSYMVGDIIAENRQEDKVESAEIWRDGETLDWVKVISRKENSITFKVTVPSDPRIKSINIAGMGPGSIYGGLYLLFSIRFSISENAGQLSLRNQIATMIAPLTAGEDGGTTIWNGIVEGLSSITKDLTSAEKIGISLGGALAAAGALSTVGGGKNKGDKDSKEEEEKKKKTYKMKVYKGFGDAIRKGDQAVSVWARIVESEELPERTREMIRDDLTEKISASGEGMDVRLIGMQNNYMGAEISIPADSEAQTATLIFTFTGAGGVMHNRITFRVIGEPCIRFPEFTEDGGSWILYETASKALLLGDRHFYSVFFCFQDAFGEPIDIDLIPNKQCMVDMKWFRVPEYPNTYKVLIENLTKLPRRSIFTSPQNMIVTIRANFQNGDIAEGAFDLSFYQDGLTVQTKAELENGRVVIHAFTDEIYYGDDTEAKSRFVYTNLFFTLAIRTDKGVEILQPHDDMLEFGKLEGKGSINQNIAAKYDFSIGPTPNEGWYQLQQRDMLYEQEEPFLVELPITAHYDQETRDMELPIRLRGKAPDPLEDWRIERQKLLFRLRKFVDDDAKRAEWFFLVKEKMANGEVSALTFRIMSKSVIIDYMVYWMYEGKIGRLQETAYNYLIDAANGVKWLMSVAFSYAMEAFAGPVASSILQPAFDMMLDSVEELTAAVCFSRSFNIDNLPVARRLAEANDNMGATFLGSALDLEHPITNWRMNAQFISMYLALSFFKNLVKKKMEKDQWDIPGVIFDTFKDLTVNMFKIIAGNLFRTWLEKAGFVEKAEEKVAGEVQKGFLKFFARSGGASNAALGKGDIWTAAQVFVSSFVGEGIGKVFDKSDKTSLDWQNNGDIVFSFPLLEVEGEKPIWCMINITASINIALQSGSTALPLSPFSILYDWIFGSTPTASAPVTFTMNTPMDLKRKQDAEQLLKSREEYYKGNKKMLKES